ncbi:MAG: S9 family peptidase [Planctomycetia bacterium]|nr:S9 family peptidase [Planctomycetia bacterium]
MIRRLLTTGLALGICGGLCSAGSSWAATPAAVEAPAAKALDQVPLIPRTILFGNPDKVGPEISPDGKQLAFVAPLDGVLNVWVAPIDDLAKARAITHDKHRGVTSFLWAFTGQHILYTQDTDGDENYRLYCVDLKTDATRPLTPPAVAKPGEEAPPVRAEIENVSHRFPHEILVGLNDRDPRFHDVYLLDILTGEKKLVQKNPDFSGFVTDEDFHIRFAMKYAPDGSIRYYEPDGKQGWKEFLKVPVEDTSNTGMMGFDKTGDILYLRDSRGRDTSALVALNLKTGEKKLIASDERADLGAIKSHPTENTIQAVNFTYDRRHRQVFDPEVKKDLDLLEKVTHGEMGLASWSLDDRQWIVADLVDDGPVSYYHFNRDTKETKFLFVHRQALKGLPLVHTHAQIIKARDGLPLVSYYSLPPGNDGDRPAKPLPMVLLVHGGPWARDSWGYDPEHQLWANRGYAVLSVNFRGSTGFGKKFINAGNHEWAGKMHDDLLDAVKWAVDAGIADPKKVAIMGGSYGGYATLVGLTFTPEEFACGVDIVGPSSLVTLLNTIPPYWASGLQMFKDRVGDHTTEAGRKELEKRSPLTLVDRIERPLLIAQGANDPRVKQAEADQIVKAMQKKGLPITYVLFPDEGHGFARPANNLGFYAVAEAFLARHLGGRAEPIGDAVKKSTAKVPVGVEQVPGLSTALD